MCRDSRKSGKGKSGKGESEQAAAEREPEQAVGWMHRCVSWCLMSARVL